MTTIEYKKILDGLNKIYNQQLGLYDEDFLNPEEARNYTDGVLRGLCLAMSFIRNM